MSERGRRNRESEERISPEEAIIAIEAKGIEEKVKPLKHARSQAELIRVRQGWMLISLNCLNASMTILILLKTFGII